MAQRTPYDRFGGRDRSAGGSPADQAVTLIEWRVQPGESIRHGQVIAELEADKAVVEYSSPYEATVEELLVEPGVEVPVGTPILRLRLDDPAQVRKVVIREEPGEPLLTPKSAFPAPVRRAVSPSTVFVSRPACVEGERVVTNDELAAGFMDRTAEDIYLLDPTDFDTAILFGDAASATVVASSGLKAPLGHLHRPILFSKPDAKGALRVGFTNGRTGCRSDGRPHPALLVEMDYGKRVFGQAVRSMDYALGCASQTAGYRPDNLSVVVPHQANGRIIDAVSAKLGDDCKVVNAIAETGNTSSSSIPLALMSVAASDLSTIGLCAFGGGFTYGAAIIDQGD